MTAISMVGYMHRLKQIGFTDEQSEFQATHLEQVMESVKQEVKEEIRHEMQAGDLTLRQEVVLIRKDLDVVKNDVNDLKNDVNDLKKDMLDVKLAISALRYESLKFCVWTGVTVIVTLSGMLAKGFHWF